MALLAPHAGDLSGAESPPQPSHLLDRGGAGWLLVPCCLQVDAYLPASHSVRLSDEMRYALLCGAMASEYEATVVWALDSRITGRGIVLGGGPPLEHDLEARVSTRPQFVCDSISIERKYPP